MEQFKIKHQNKQSVPNEDLENPLSPNPCLIEYNLSISPEQRLINHQCALETINELINARKQIYGEHEFIAQAST